MIVQIMGFITYVTAQEEHHPYLKDLAALRLFDYEDSDAMNRNRNRAPFSLVILRLSLEHCLAAIQRVKGEGIATVAYRITFRSQC